MTSRPAVAEPPRLLVFYDKTCGLSRRVEAYLAHVLQAHRNHSTFRVSRVEVAENPAPASAFRVEATPTLFVVEDGKVQRRLERPSSRREIEEALAPWLLRGKPQQPAVSG